MTDSDTRRFIFDDIFVRKCSPKLSTIQVMVICLSCDRFGPSSNTSWTQVLTLGVSVFAIFLSTIYHHIFLTPFVRFTDQSSRLTCSISSNLVSYWTMDKLIRKMLMIFVYQAARRDNEMR